MKRPRGEFYESVCDTVRQIPAGRVSTYGDVSAVAGNPRAARVVGMIAHYGDLDIPWHRIVNRDGKLASGYHGGREVQATILASEGVETDGMFVLNFMEKRWKK